jgi:acyl-coenzyme A thioesterase PaaI-like protein
MIADDSGGHPGDGEQAPVSASRLAEMLGDRLPTVESVPGEAFALTAAVRELVEAVVLSDVPPEDLAAATAQVQAVTEALRRRQRDHLQLVRHADGRIESLRNAGAGRLNPQAPPLEWLHRPTEPPPGTAPAPVEVEARCVFTAAHGGSPGRVYGGVIALVLDEVTGIAIRVAGASGMTVALRVSLKGGVPIGAPATVVARYTGGEGRKSFASGEMIVDGKVVAEAEVIYVRERGA